MADLVISFECIIVARQKEYMQKVINSAMTKGMHVWSNSTGVGNTWKPGKNKYGNCNVISRSPLRYVQTNKNGVHTSPAKISGEKTITELANVWKLKTDSSTRTGTNECIDYSFSWKTGSKPDNLFGSWICILPLHHMRPKLLSPLDFPGQI